MIFIINLETHNAYSCQFYQLLSLGLWPVEAKGERKDLIKANCSLVSTTHNRQYVGSNKVFDQVTAWKSIEQNFRWKITANKSNKEEQMLAIYFTLICKKSKASLFALELSRFISTKIWIAAAISIIYFNLWSASYCNFHNWSPLELVVLSI